MRIPTQKHAEQEYYRIAFPSRTFHVERPSDWSPENTQLSTIADFKFLWDDLAKREHQLIVPTQVQYPGGNDPFKIGLAFGKFTITDTVHPVLTEAGPTELEFFGMPDKGGFDFEFPVKRFIFVRVTQSALSHVFVNWKVGPYDTAFSDLSRATHDLEMLELDDVSKVLSEEASHGGEVFEALGMRVPANQITFWGTVIVIAVQLYLFIYLRQLSGKLAPDDPGWDIPWIGLNMTHLARSLLFVSVVLLPSVAVALLGWHTLTKLEGTLPRYWAILKEVGLTVVCVTVTLLGIATWRYRPRVLAGTVPEPTTSQQSPSSAQASEVPTTTENHPK